jgi:PAS domain S-box-containing protein
MNEAGGTHPERSSADLHSNDVTTLEHAERGSLQPNAQFEAHIETERKQSEEALRVSEERLWKVLDSAPDAIFIRDPGGTFLDVNRTACERLGYSRDELLTMTPADIEPLEFSALLPERSEAILRGSACFETAHLRRDGTVFPVEINATVVDLGDRKAVLAIARDISERKHAEAERAALDEQLWKAQKMEGIGHLAGSLALDVNNLVTAILGNANLALAELPQDGVLREELEQIDKAAARADRLTRQLLTLARRTVLEPEVLNLGAIVRHLEPTLGPLLGEKITLVTVTPGDTGSVLVDRGEIEQAIVNLAVNARDAMPDGGTLKIAISDLEDTEATESPAQAGSASRMTILSVTDTGVGMDAEVMKHLFEPFFTTKNPRDALGLGLATAYGIVRQFGGTITASSEPGRGSTFNICLPQVKETDRAGSEPQHSAAAGGPRTGTIPVVEDDSGVSRGLVRPRHTGVHRPSTESGRHDET